MAVPTASDANVSRDGDALVFTGALDRAAAASLILFVIILLFTMLQRFIQRKWKYD